MGKRTVRIPQSKIAAHLGQLPGKSAQVVMTSGETHFGVVATATADGLTMQDTNAAWTSTKRHTQTLPFNDIQWIILDIISPW